MVANLILGIITGLGLAGVYFIAGAGLTTVYGVLHIPNFAHGAFIMIGGYVAFALTGGISVGMPLYIGAVLVAGVVVGVLAGASETLIIRRGYRAHHYAGVILTFGLLLMVQGGAELVWGLSPRAQHFPQGLDSALTVWGLKIPTYSLVVLAAAALIGGTLWIVLSHSKIGMVIRAAAHDRDMAAAVGINVPKVFTGIFIAGGVLAGVAGALATPNYALSPDMGAVFLLTAFAVVIVGGMGSIRGAALAAVILGVGGTLLTVYAGRIGGISLYVPMIAVLLFRPRGLIKGW